MKKMKQKCRPDEESNRSCSRGMPARLRCTLFFGSWLPACVVGLDIVEGDFYLANEFTFGPILEPMIVAGHTLAAMCGLVAQSYIYLLRNSLFLTSNPFCICWKVILENISVYKLRSHWELFIFLITLLGCILSYTIEAYRTLMSIIFCFWELFIEVSSLHRSLVN